jgi:cobalt-zinc-cadmium efflux system protein
MSHHHACQSSDTALDRRLWLTVALNVAITAAEFIGGLLSGSLVLLSDAAHNLSDVVGLVFALGARQLSRRPPTLRHTYGFKRIEVVAALANAVLVIGVTVLIGREAVVRLWHPEPAAQGLMLVIGLIALGVNVDSLLLLRRHDEDDVNVRGAFLHMAQDAAASLAVVVAALLARTKVGPYADPAAALLVGLLVFRGAVSLVWETVSTVLEGVPPDLDVAELVERVGREFAPVQLHHIHVWQIGPGQRVLTAHAMIGEPLEAQAIEALLSRIKEFLHDNWDINHSTLEPEVTECERSELLGRW